MKKTQLNTVLVFLTLLFACTTLFSAIVETTTQGKLNAEVLTIDKDGVTIKSRLGSTFVKAENVKYVLMDEKRTDLVGKKGIHLVNGTVVYGEPAKITKDNGVIIHKYGNILLSLNDLIYFTYDNNDPSVDGKMEQLQRVRFGRMKITFNDKLEKPLVQLPNNTIITADAINIQQQSDKVTFKIKSGNIEYQLLNPWIEYIELPKKTLETSKQLINLSDGSIIIGNLRFAKDTAVITTPFSDTLMVPINNIVNFSHTSLIVPNNNTSNTYIRLGEIEPYSFSYDPKMFTLTINIFAEKLTYDGNVIQSLEIPVANTK